MQLEDFNLKDPRQFFEALIQKALEGEASEFEFIRSYNMLKVARMYKAGVKKVVKIFDDLIKKLIYKYEKAIIVDEQTLELLMTIKQFEFCRNYYKKEVLVAKDMISEYKAYVFGGHVLNTMLGYTRPESECVDYRKLPWTFF